MVTPGTSGVQLVWISSAGSSNGRVEAYITSPWMPPFSPAPKGFLPNSRNEFCPEKPCQPSVTTQGGSMRPVEPPGPLEPPVTGPVAMDTPVQSAVAQYTAPGTRRAAGTPTCSAVFAMRLAMVELPHGAVPPPRHA